MVKKILIALGLGIAFFVVIQLIPYGRNHANPAIIKEIPWNSPQTRELAVRACYDCHSNETVWPWYSNIAPFSWLIQHDVEEGRGELNFSDWDRFQRKAGEAAREIQSGRMPKSIYLPLHPDANLSAAEKQQLIDGLREIVSQR